MIELSQWLTISSHHWPLAMYQGSGPVWLDEGVRRGGGRMNLRKSTGRRFKNLQSMKRPLSFALLALVGLHHRARTIRLKIKKADAWSSKKCMIFKADCVMSHRSR